MEDKENNTGQNIATNTAKGTIKKVLGFLKKPLKILIIVVIIAFLIVGAGAWYMKEDDGTQNNDDPKNGPAAANMYINDINISDDGKISLAKSAEDLWEELKEKDNRLTAYLNSPEELLKLMNAQIATEYLDTRNETDIDKDIDWKEVNENIKSTDVQGIIKLKRKMIDGNEYSMTYVAPDEFESYVNNGNVDKALKHFTIEKKSNSEGSIGNLVSSEYSHWPSPDSTTINSNFGWRIHPIEGVEKFHGGTDIGASEGTNIEAAEAGTVVEVAFQGSANSGWGNYVKIDHGNGKATLYAHMKELSTLVKVGDTISKGQVIGHVGQTGGATGPHLHFEVYVDGERVDAMTFKYDNGQGNGSGGIGSTYNETSNDSSEENDKTTPSQQRQYSYVAKIAIQSTSGLTVQELEYKNYINKYTMPFNYLWAMLLIGVDKDFVFDLAELVYNSEFVITVHDSLTVTTEEKYHRYMQRVVTPGENEGDPPKITYHQVTEGPFENVTEFYTTDVALTRANSWIAEYTHEYEYEYVPKTQISDTDWYGINVDVPETRSHEERIITYEMKKQYIAKPEEKPIEKTDKNATEPNFVTVFIDNYKGRSNILGAEDWLFDILEKNEDTKDMVDLTKYLFYKTTGKDYGVTDFDTVWSAYRQESFSSFSGIYGGTVEEKVWFVFKSMNVSDVAAAAAMGNLSYESGGQATKSIRTDTIEGGYNEYNGGIGMCQWTNNARGSTGRNQQLHDYAAYKQTDWRDPDTQIEFLIGELLRTGDALGFTDPQFITKTYAGVTYSSTAWKNVGEDEGQLEYATKAFAATFERPNERDFISSMSARVNLAKYFYQTFKGRTAPVGGNGDVLAACEEVMRMFLSRNAHYSVDAGRLIYNDINRCLTQSNYICCASYTTCVLYKAGLLPADHINKYNYQWTGSGGIPDMLRDAGWRKVPMSERQPGDVANKDTVHVLIYAGGDNYYDQSTCVVSSSGRAPTRGIRSGFMSAYGSYDIWRAPGR